MYWAILNPPICRSAAVSAALIIPDAASTAFWTVALRYWRDGLRRGTRPARARADRAGAGRHREEDVRGARVPDRRQHVRRRQRPGRPAASLRSLRDRRAGGQAACGAGGDARARDGRVAARGRGGRAFEGAARTLGGARGRLRALAAAEAL